MELTTNKNGSELVLHMLNYDLTTPVHPVTATITLPPGKHVVTVHFLSPDQPEQDLKFQEADGRVRLTFPNLVVYNMAVLSLK